MFRFHPFLFFHKSFRSKTSDAQLSLSARNYALSLRAEHLSEVPLVGPDRSPASFPQSWRAQASAPRDGRRCRFRRRRRKQNHLLHFLLLRSLSFPLVVDRHRRRAVRGLSSGPGHPAAVQHQRGPRCASSAVCEGERKLESFAPAAPLEASFLSLFSLGALLSFGLSFSPLETLKIVE